MCDSNDAKYNRGSCAAPHEIRRSIISLWFAYGVDVLSDLLVMFLPFRLTWNLQMPRVEKVGVFLLFGTGWVLIVRASSPASWLGRLTVCASSSSPRCASSELASQTACLLRQIRNG